MIDHSAATKPKKQQKKQAENQKLTPPKGVTMAEDHWGRAEAPPWADPPRSPTDHPQSCPAI